MMDMSTGLELSMYNLELKKLVQAFNLLEIKKLIRSTFLEYNGYDLGGDVVFIVTIIYHENS